MASSANFEEVPQQSLVQSQGAARDTAVTIPVGLPGGVLQGPSDDGSGGEAFVKRGRNFHFMPAAQYALWIASQVRQSRRLLHDWAEENQIPSAKELTDDLWDTGLLLELSGNSEDNALLRHVTVHLVTYGARLSTDGWFEVAHDGQPAVRLSSALYMLLLYCDGRHSLWDACVDLAEADVGPAKVATQLLDSLPALVQANVVLLDAI